MMKFDKYIYSEGELTDKNAPLWVYTHKGKPMWITQKEAFYLFVYCGWGAWSNVPYPKEKIIDNT